MRAPRDAYAEKAISQIPRLLSLQDRNPFSPTYGCFHRDYWLDKTSDFPDAVRQFGVQALALVYRCDFPGSPYKGRSKIRDWAIAGLDFWTRIQHRDGSFDEFYPYERGWVGPSAFTTYTATEAYRLLQDEIPEDVAERVRQGIRRAARFIAAGEAEADHLANHHAMACLAVWKAYELLGDSELKSRFERLWQGLLAYQDRDEGWSSEYDGPDPGYLSATVSFLAKVYQTNPDRRILDVLRDAVEFCSYFVYPDGSYAGSLGSRNTAHFYPHGFEILAREIPLAAAVAERMLRALAEGKLVPPEIMADRYVFYRVPEFLQAYLDYAPRAADLPPLPYERQPFTRYFPRGRVFVAVRGPHYVVSNLGKGGVVKVFDRAAGRQLLNDGGLIGRLEDGRVVTSQWVDPEYACEADDRGWQVAGRLQVVAAHKLFTPVKHLLFRGVLVLLGWSPPFSHLLKRRIRRTLALGCRPVPVSFRRRLTLDADAVALRSAVRLEGAVRVAALSFGDEFHVRYVPQSRYFQPHELDTAAEMLDANRLQALNGGQMVTVARVVSTPRETRPSGASADPRSTPAGTPHARPKGAYGVEYYVGRQRKRQLVYRLRRRTDEVEAALRRYGGDRLKCVLDLGTADGLMPLELQRRMGWLTLVGIDLSFELLRAHPASEVLKVQGDALAVPIRANVADAVITTAVIEHVSDPAGMLRECRHVLREQGLLVLTTPVPFWEEVASAVGLLKESGHYRTLDLKELRELVGDNGFAVLEARKFMFSPVGFPGEKILERVLGPLGLRLMMANQLVVARKC